MSPSFHFFHKFDVNFIFHIVFIDLLFFFILLSQSIESQSFFLAINVAFFLFGNRKNCKRRRNELFTSFIWQYFLFYAMFTLSSVIWWMHVCQPYAFHQQTPFYSSILLLWFLADVSFCMLRWISFHLHARRLKCETIIICLFFSIDSQSLFSQKQKYIYRFVSHSLVHFISL